MSLYMVVSRYPSLTLLRRYPTDASTLLRPIS